ncbi:MULTISPECIES: ferrochelatase [unclassified Caulobacter]|uniref:ferrochelatase n=1 Tax=unclassified Caulobacter TaxID=2648921 RepID=UPI0006FE0D62|nr:MULTISPECIES: ferrochelatase [unclassified Caulobacter]KQV62135.1 ferrochelatase [Caulobacter sp. Root342]KQV63055.1 ferrochelatase [Caulobacter sp. Root343]
MSRKLAVVLFNLGGPDGPRAVRPFLFNLFRDPAIIGLPAIARYPVAALIATTREKTAKANYAIMGGGSPLLPETEKQARTLETELARTLPGVEAKCFIAMRYWNPLTGETAKAVKAFGPDEVVLLPLYPQYSATTTGSSLKAWRETYSGGGRQTTVCCYPTEDGLIAAHVRLIRETWEKAGSPANVRLLFSAHGLPEKVILAGDPYQKQIEATAAAVAARLPADLDWTVCYQSRVGPMKWIGPSTDDEIRRAGADGKGVIVTPIAFVSEHVETLVELDHEYAELAREVGVAPYLRVPALGAAPEFIGGLAKSVAEAIAKTGSVAPACGWRCGPELSNCPCGEGASA